MRVLRERIMTRPALLMKIIFPAVVKIWSGRHVQKLLSMRRLNNRLLIVATRRALSAASGPAVGWVRFHLIAPTVNLIVAQERCA